MASIALSVVGCIDYLAYGAIFTRATFRPKIKLGVFFFRQKSSDERWEVVSDVGKKIKKEGIRETLLVFCIVVRKRNVDSSCV